MTEDSSLAMRFDNLLVSLLASKDGVVIGENHTKTGLTESLRHLLPRLKAHGVETLSLELPQVAVDSMITARSPEQWVQDNGRFFTGGKGDALSAYQLVRAAHSQGFRVLGHESLNESLAANNDRLAKALNDLVMADTKLMALSGKLDEAVARGDRRLQEVLDKQVAARIQEVLADPKFKDRVEQLKREFDYRITSEGMQERNNAAAAYIRKNRLGKVVALVGSNHTGSELNKPDRTSTGSPAEMKPYQGLDKLLGWPSIDVDETATGPLGKATKSQGDKQKYSDYTVAITESISKLNLTQWPPVDGALQLKDGKVIWDRKKNTNSTDGIFDGGVEDLPVLDEGHGVIGRLVAQLDPQVKKLNDELKQATAAGAGTKTKALENRIAEVTAERLKDTNAVKQMLEAMPQLFDKMAQRDAGFKERYDQLKSASQSGDPKAVEEAEGRMNAYLEAMAQDPNRRAWIEDALIGAFHPSVPTVKAPPPVQSEPAAKTKPAVVIPPVTTAPTTQGKHSAVSTAPTAQGKHLAGMRTFVAQNKFGLLGALIAVVAAAASGMGAPGAMFALVAGTLAGSLADGQQGIFGQLSHSGIMRHGGHHVKQEYASIAPNKPHTPELNSGNMLETLADNARVAIANIGQRLQSQNVMANTSQGDYTMPTSHISGKNVNTASKGR